MAPQPLARWAGVCALASISALFGSNHVAARVAFEHGANVQTAVAFRSAGTALFVLALILAQRVPLALPRATLVRAGAIGLLLAVQSYCLYSAVARIPVALALLAFQTFPMVLALLTWAAEGRRPRPRTLVAMPVALAGLALALDVAGAGGSVKERWNEIGAGVLWASAASLAFAAVLHLTERWLPALDGRLRTLVIMAVVAAVTIVASAATASFRLPADATGWAGLALLTLLYGGAMIAFFAVLPRVDALNTSFALNFEPVAVLAIAWVVLDQALAPVQILGMAVVLGAIVVGARK
ncbi:MAG: DMT family transporter [Burkholderiales bacterium]|nr:DMT family transporter [Burkholderiales bacterium]